MKRKLCLVLIAGFSLGAVGASLLPAQETAKRLPLSAKDIDASLQTDWYGVYLQGKKMGYAQVSRQRIGAGDEAAIRDSLSLTLKLVLLGKKADLKISQSLDYDARAPYRLRGGDYWERDEETSQKVKLARDAKGYKATHTAGKEERTQHLPDLDYTLADTFATEVLVRRGAKPGDEIVSRDFDLKTLKIQLIDVKLLSIKSSLVGGVDVKVFEIENRFRRQNLLFRSRHDQTGRLLSGQVSILELRLEPENQAKDVKYSQDLFVLGQVKIDRPLGDPRQVTALVLEITGKEGKQLASGPRQEIKGKAPGPYTLKLGKKYGRPVKASPQEIEENLADSNAYPIKNAKIKALAAKAVGDAQSPQDKVRRLAAFVHDFIQPGLSASQPNIPELLIKKRGDCKSYALLFATLARAAGIPAREISGLMYIGDDLKAFGGHAWNEVVLDGHWVPIDATFAETEINATHISFGDDNQSIPAMLAALGKLSFKVVEVETK
jgi:hypothetical protein